MSNVETGIMTYLLAQTGLTALVSTRIKPLILDTNSPMPGITMNRVATVPVNRQEGASTEYRSRFQFDIWASSYSSAKAVASQLRLALNGFSGTMGSSRVDSVVLLDDTDDFEPENDNVRVIQEYEFYHVE